MDRPVGTWAWSDGGRIERHAGTLEDACSSNSSEGPAGMPTRSDRGKA